jgi:hypothetical protein
VFDRQFTWSRRKIALYLNALDAVAMIVTAASPLVTTCDCTASRIA